MHAIVGSIDVVIPQLEQGTPDNQYIDISTDLEQLDIASLNAMYLRHSRNIMAKLDCWLTYVG